MFFLLDGRQKVLDHRHPFTPHYQKTALQGVDDLIAIAKTAADQRHMAIFLSRTSDDLRPTSIGVHGVIALLCRADFLAALQCEYQASSSLLDHPAIAGQTALGCDSVNGVSGMSVHVRLPLANNRQRLFAKLRKSFFSEVGGIKTAEKLSGDFVGI
ncbi:hypothetical protein BOO88_18600 [Stutzerimonas stutzeri]|nr:hypothetical protein BOO88_18600 [Stutzerimonas stutzeri]